MNRDKLGRKYDLGRQFHFNAVVNSKAQRDQKRWTLWVVVLLLIGLLVLILASSRPAGAEASTDGLITPVGCDLRIEVTFVTSRPLSKEPQVVCHPADDPTLVLQAVVRCDQHDVVTQAVVTIWEAGSFDGWAGVLVVVPCAFGVSDQNYQVECNSSEANALVINATGFGNSQPRFKCSGYLD